MSRVFFVVVFCALLGLSACSGGNFAPIIDKGGRYYGKQRNVHRADSLDYMIEALSQED